MANNVLRKPNRNRRRAATNGYSDPGPTPTAWFEVPGFIHDVAAHSLATCPRPNPGTAFAGALALQAFLAGGKIQDAEGNRTNLNLLLLGPSGSAKTWALQVNEAVLRRVGLEAALMHDFASPEAVVAAFQERPARLIHLEYLETHLRRLSKPHSGSARIIARLMDLYLRGEPSREAGESPCVLLVGASVDATFRRFVPRRFLAHPYFEHVLLLEASEEQPPAGKFLGHRDKPPESVVEAARGWAEARPQVAATTAEAEQVLQAAAGEIEAEREAVADPVHAAVWRRGLAKVRKLALLHAVSVNRQRPEIDAEAARWAAKFVLHQTRRLLSLHARRHD